MRAIRPIADFGRAPIHGRIRTGEKGAKGQPVALKTFRLTSSDEQAIGTLAGMYGGTPRPWDEPRASVQGQWQVTTEANELDVLLPEGALYTAYEKWSGGGCERRCDGETCVIPGPDEDEEAPCLCAVQNVMQCKPKVRLSVMFPGIEFRGVWRLDSSSWAAAEEMAAVEPILQQVQARGILRAKLVLEQRSKPGKRFVVPKLVLAATLEELASGQAGLPGVPVVQAPALMAGEDRPLTPEFEVARIVDEGVLSPSDEPNVARLLDSEIIDAEIVDEPSPRSGLSPAHRALHAALATVCTTHILDPDDLRHRLVRTLTKGRASSSNDLTKEEMGRALEILGEVNAGVRDVELVGEGDVGTVKMKVTT